MNKEQLKEQGLTDEQADAVLALHKAKLDETVPKSRFNDKVTEVNDLKQTLADRDQQLTDLQVKAEGHDKLQADIAALQEQNATATAEYEQKLQQQQFDFALTDALRDAKAKNPTAVKALLQLDSIEFVDGKLKGLDKQLETLKGTDDYLFVADGLRGATPPGGNTPPPQINPFAKDTLNLTEQGRLLRDNPQLAQQLQALAGN